MPNRPRFTGLWRHPDFVRLWAAQTVSLFGSLIGGLALQFTAIIWLDASAIGLSVLLALQIVPGFAFGLAAGVWVDRLPRRKVMIAADLGRFAILCTVPLAAVLDVLTIEQLWAVAFATTTLTVAFDVAYEAYLPSLVRPQDLVEGNSKLTASASMAEVGSFSLAGWLVQLIKGPGAVLVDAVSFLWSALWLLRIRTPEPPAHPAYEREHLLREARSGIALVWHHPVLRAFAGAGVFIAICHGTIGVLILLYLNRELGWQPGVLGLLFAVGGVTSLLGSFVASRILPAGLGWSVILARFLVALGALTLPLTPSVGAIGAACLIAGQLTDSAATYYEIHAVSIRQAAAPERLQGRVNATMRFVTFGGMLAGLALAAMVSELTGPRQGLFLAAAVSFAGAIWLAFSPIRKMRAAPSAFAEDSDGAFPPGPGAPAPLAPTPGAAQ